MVKGAIQGGLELLLEEQPSGKHVITPNSLYLANTKKGIGVFANKDFEHREEIMYFSGELVKGDDIPPYAKPEDDRHLQIGEDLYFGPSHDFDDYINHSCNPNSGIIVTGTKAPLIALKNIRKNQEITWDYSTTMDEDEWEMDCLCGSKNCRGRIRDFKYLPKNIQQKYIRLGIVPDYAVKSMNDIKR